MNIGELERISGLKRSTIRVYEKLGLLTPDDDRRGNGYRTYGHAHVDRLASIKLAQTLGFRLKDIRALMQAWENGSMTKAEKLAAMQTRLSEVREKQASLARLETWLADIILWIERGETGTKPKP
ncbi:MerR family transcriptional regulator [Aquidulcibacter sp.]|jgi:MerR family mercuric resistance operon transcriptional regulator|uniref:MerR family transcriptional regulator n=1 Tax=Aquidulcibacter sp. TaxID=2052990 RepID=UPI0028A81534|nr:MerR family transcriptional regulator [Aquidulcibacter sp.]